MLHDSEDSSLSLSSEKSAEPDTKKMESKHTRQESDESFLIQEYSLVSLDWQSDDEMLRQIEENPPASLYPAIGDAIRAGLSSETLCKSFCGGKSCKYCCPVDRFPDDCFAIKGLYSHWVTPDILAMSRPSDAAIRQYDIIKQFHECNIKSVFCVQVPDEHADCGHGLVGGYSYDQTGLMRHGIAVYNLNWDDYTSPGFHRMLDLVRVMQFALTEGRLAVHCHAGLGRTGLAIACFLVFVRRVSPAVAVAYLRQKRPGSVQSHAQVSGVGEFADRIRPMLVLWPDRRLRGGHRFSYEEHVRRQRAVLHGEAARRLRRLSQLVHTVCQRMLRLRLPGAAGRRRILEAALADAAAATASEPPKLDAEAREWRDLLNREGSYRPVLDCSEPGRLFAFLLCWLWELKEAAVTGQHASLLLTAPTITGGLERLNQFTATLLRYCAVFLLRLCQAPGDDPGGGHSQEAGGGHHMDDLEEDAMLQLVSALTRTRLSLADAAGSYSQMGKWFASFLDYTECLMERPGISDYQVWAAPLRQLHGATGGDCDEAADAEGASAMNLGMP